MSKNPTRESCLNVAALNRRFKKSPKFLEKVLRVLLKSPDFLIYGLNTYERDEDTCVFEVVSVDHYNRLHTVLILFDMTGEIGELGLLTLKLLSEHQKRDQVRTRELIDVIIITPDEESKNRLFLSKRSKESGNKSIRIKILNALYRGESEIGKLFEKLEKLD